MVVSILPGFAQTTSIDITGNLVNNTQTATTSTGTWQNATFQNSLTCWAWGDPGYCGPNPIVRPSGDINFSFGMVDLHQRVNVGKALPYGGTGLVTTGFTFAWTSKNGNGWDDGRQDVLSAYVKLYSSGDTKVIESFNYSLNYIHNWTTYSYSETWKNTKVGYRENQVGNVQFGFIGMDNNYWAGPYGPEVRDVNFQLRYKPDPCKNNPLFSPECPNFTQELAKNNTITTDTKTSTSSQDNTETLPPPPPPKDNKDIDLAKEDDRYEEGYVEIDIDRLVDTLFKIQDNQNREEKITMQASENAIKETDKIALQTVKQAEKAAEKLTKDSVQNSMPIQQAVASDTRENKNLQSLSLLQAPSSSITEMFKLPGAQQTSTLHLQNQSTQTQAVNLSQQEQGYKPPLQISIYSLGNTTQADIATNQTNIVGLNTNSVGFQNYQATSAQTIASPISLLNPLSNQLPETTTISTSFLTNKADPINTILDNKQQNATSDKEQSQTQQVKAKVDDNDAAAGVSIDTIAKTPIGFNSYTIALRDVAFYAPKEIYRNQRVVDNQRALRQLSSDRLHQEMIELQYRSR
jgi:hypothetical protein